MPQDSGELTGFAERLLAVIDAGRRTATYKLAVLLAIIDCCAEGVSSSGEAPLAISTRTIARHVAALYWPQLRPFPAPSGELDLRQITNKSPATLSAMRVAFNERPDARSFEDAEAQLTFELVEPVLDLIELTVARYPPLRLQTIDGVSSPFTYDVAWDERVTLSRLRAGAVIELRERAGAVIELRERAGDQLIRLAPLVRPLVELHWVRMVADLNRLGLVEDDLRRHLFGAERVAFPFALRRGLLELQEGRCLYCSSPLASSGAVSHFVPWSR